MKCSSLSNNQFIVRVCGYFLQRHQCLKSLLLIWKLWVNLTNQIKRWKSSQCGVDFRSMEIASLNCPIRCFYKVVREFWVRWKGVKQLSTEHDLLQENSIVFFAISMVINFSEHIKFSLCAILLCTFLTCCWYDNCFLTLLQEILASSIIWLSTLIDGPVDEVPKTMNFEFSLIVVWKIIDNWAISFLQILLANNNLVFQEL